MSKEAGLKQINGVKKQYNKMLGKLCDGIEKLRGQHLYNAKMMDDLADENEDISVEIEEAEGIKAGIESIVGKDAESGEEESN